LKDGVKVKQEKSNKIENIFIYGHFQLKKHLKAYPAFPLSRYNRSMLVQ